MRRPARVANTKWTVHRPVRHQFRQAVIDGAHFFSHFEPAIAHCGQTGAVIAAILQAPQAVKNNEACVLAPDIAYDAAHNLVIGSGSVASPTVMMAGFRSPSFP